MPRVISARKLEVEFEHWRLSRFCVGARCCPVVLFYFARSAALRAVTGIARRLVAIFTLISRRLSDQNINQRGMDSIPTFFRSVTFRAYRRCHINSSFTPNLESPDEFYRKNGHLKEDRASDRINRT